MKIVFALLAHGYPSLVERLVQALISQNHHVVVHYDRKSSSTSYQYLVNRFADEKLVRFADRVRVAWGEWSVVQAALNCLDIIEQAGWQPDYVYQLSGMDYPIRPAAQLEAFLNRNHGDEFIESVPSEEVRWVKTGPQRERYCYRWPFNWRDQARRTDLWFAVQKRLGLERRFVRGLTPYVGSQWWVLTWRTLRKIMALAQAPDIRRFFATTLVPDELFFQTMVRHVAPCGQIVSCSLTLHQFSDYGYPLVFHADHLDYLLRQPFFMARKLSPHSDALRDLLDPVWRGEQQVAPFHDHDVGLRGAEYEDWRLDHRDGVPGRPVVARSAGRWYEDQKRLKIPYFAVVGTSTAELRVVHRALNWHPDLLCHGQVFHPNRLEFAGGAAQFAGYGSENLKLREVSAPNFVADLVRAEKRRMSGLLLRWGQGWHMSELMFDRPNIRVLLVRGDPLTAFIETLLGAEPLLDQPLDDTRLHSMPAKVMATRFRRFLPEYERHRQWLEQQADKGDGVKPAGWVARLDVRAGRMDWLRHTEECLGISLAAAPEAARRTALSEALEEMNERRDRVAHLLIKGGIARVVIDTLRQEADRAQVAVSLMA